MGLITIPDLSDATDADANDINSRNATILGLVNGNIDSANIKAAGVATTNLATDAVTTTKISAGAVTAAKIETQEAWITPTLSGGWVPFGSPFPPLQYMKDSLGFVVLRGVSRLGTIGSSTVFTLPAGYRPATDAQVYQSVASNGVFGITEVKSTGDVVFSAGNNGAHSAFGVRFKAEQ